MGVNSQQLLEEASKFLNKDVLAVGLFHVSLTVGNERADVDTSTDDDDDGNTRKYNVGNRILTGVVSATSFLRRQQLMKHNDAKEQNKNPIMICAVTESNLYLLDWKWKGTHTKGKEPTEILAEFNLNHSKIKIQTKKLVHHIVEIEED